MKCESRTFPCQMFYFLLLHMNLLTGGPSFASQGLGALGTIHRHIPTWGCQVIIMTISAFLLQKCFPFVSAVITETIGWLSPWYMNIKFSPDRHASHAVSCLAFI